MSTIPAQPKTKFEEWTPQMNPKIKHIIHLALCENSRHHTEQCSSLRNNLSLQSGFPTTELCCVFTALFHDVQANPL